ncbi:DNA-directed RNA polymerase III, subunit Rpc31 [Lineolata rhizophorae]|uniref:DNA-directed RNA polymerase III subunit n=1 Tax=Lineolata rhizophorae TaxID=578093 RepID=A0A6A6NNS9_9PEZI|nr:DNA-directed RNA polymerase III, subunit Rpc31 [Lineolata rhizophorae]
MSRGGRGGFRGGRGRGRGGSGFRGVDVPWEHDPDLQVDYKPSEQFPPRALPVSRKPYPSERFAVSQYRALRSRIHEGPLYTVLTDPTSAHVTKPGARGAATATATANVDPFEAGVPTYSMKYRRKRRRIPRLDTRPYVLRYFPEELWSVMEGAAARDKDAQGPKPLKKKLQIARAATRLSRLEEELEREEQGANEDKLEDEERERRLVRKQRIKGLGSDDEDEGEREEDEDQDAEPEVQDSVFDDDEDVGAEDDYNAENYFDNGEEDYDDYADAGDGGGYDDFE